MTAPNPNAYRDWWANSVGAAVPWLAGGTNGQLEAKAWPALLDYYVSQIVQARYQAFPDYCAVDALAHQGADRQFIQGANESNASFQARIKAAFDTWPRAGTACGVLEQLWYYGMTGAYWVQQNGLYYTFGNSTLTPGQDPTALLQSGNTSSLIEALTSNVTPSRSIPAGTPWFSLGLDTDLTNRFAILCPTWPFSALAVANFANSDTATVTWPVAFGSATYSIIFGPPSDNVVVWADGTTQTATGVTMKASAPWTGSVWVIGFASGVNPLNVFSSASFGAIQRIITSFRPNALCAGVFQILTGGRTWDYFPAGTTWDGGTYPTWDTNTTQQILGAF